MANINTAKGLRVFSPKLAKESSDNMDYQLGRIDLDDDTKNGSHLWTNTLEHWASGNYPKHEPRSAAQRPYADFQRRLEALPESITLKPGETHPAIEAGIHQFNGIKNWDTGRHFDIHLGYEKQEQNPVDKINNVPETWNLKAKVVVPSHQYSKISPFQRRRALISAHGDHTFDVPSKQWEHGSTKKEDGYNPIDLIKNAPADFTDNHRDWGSTPTPTLAFCPTCHRFPNSLNNQLQMMFPTHCTGTVKDKNGKETICGKEGRTPNYPWEPAQYVEKVEDPQSKEIRNVETSGFNQRRGLICPNPKCSNHNKSITNDPAKIPAEWFGGEKGKVITKQLPVNEIYCDHKDCPDNGMAVPQKSRVTPDSVLPCMHCGRSSDDGVDVVRREDGYTRCNPTKYGANNCAPIPSGVKGKDAYLGWFKPDPIHKYPDVKHESDGESYLFQEPKDAGYSDSNGLYPGYSPVRARVFGPARDLMGRGVENLKDFFTFGKGHVPWRYLGMSGRDTQPKDPKKSYIDELEDEDYQPHEFRKATDIPSISAYAEQMAGSGGRSLTQQPAVKQPKDMSPIHPDISMAEYKKMFGESALAENPTTQETMKRLLDKINNHPDKFPIRTKDIGGIEDKPALPKESSKKFNSKLAAESDDNPVHDIEDEPMFDEESETGLSQTGYRPGDEESPLYKYKRPENFGEEEEPEGEPERIQCPECHGDSIFNNPGNELSEHCQSCHGECGTKLSDQTEHCKGCKQSRDGGCVGRPKVYWRSEGAICPTCQNNGDVDEYSRCNHIETKKIDGIVTHKQCGDTGSAYTQGKCLNHFNEDKPESEKAQSISPEVSMTELFEKGENKPSESEETETTPSSTFNYLEGFKTDKAYEDMLEEGYEPSEHSQGATDYAVKLQKERREEQLGEGAVSVPTEPESIEESIREMGPVKYLEGIHSKGLLGNEALERSLGRDVEEMAIGKPSYPGQARSERLDSPENLDIINRQREEAQDQGFEETPKSITETKQQTPTFKLEKHPKWCSCGGTGRATESQVSKIQNSKEFDEGIVNLKKQYAGNHNGFAAARDSFINEQTRCKDQD